jgi:hypothetical protein
MASDEPTFWVYALDEWDAWDQVTRALGLTATDERLFNVMEMPGLTMPLDLIRHSTGEWTNVPAPKIDLYLTPCSGDADHTFN